MRHKFHVLNRKNLNATRIVAGSFAAIILIGALLLSLPIASRSGQSPGFLTCLFTATSATCVTGLALVDTWLQWTFFGQLVILVMIQMGGLGFMTVVTLFSLALRRRIGLSERLIMMSTLNLSDMSGVVRLVRHTLRWTVVIESIGAILLSLRFIPQYGFISGVWKGVFHAVSSFCNAGFDLMGGGAPFASLADYSDDPLVLGTVMMLIVVGGLGFFVWMDFGQKRSIRALSNYSKLVISITGLLILFGAAMTLFVEFKNPATIGNMPLWQKILNSFFQSVTLRTAGFATFDQGGLTDTSMALGCILMLIGGSAGSTAGGIKTATLGVLILSIRASLRGRNEVSVRGRTISQRQVINAMTLTMMITLLFIIGSMFLSIVDGVPFLHGAFEAASALGTVGLTTGITPALSTASQGLLIVFMYLGRVGIITFSIAFVVRRTSESKIKYPTMDIMIG